MLKKLIGTMAVAALLAAPVQQAAAQVSKGYTDVGAVIGLGGLNGSAGVAFGGRFEHIFKELPDLGNGLLGIGVSADVYSWSSPYYSIRWIPIGATANYHFKLSEKKLDPFIGLGLGYELVSCNLDVTGYNFGCGYSSAVYVIARAGVRYFVKPNLALYGDVGAGGGALHLGATFKLK